MIRRTISHLRTSRQLFAGGKLHRRLLFRFGWFILSGCASGVAVLFELVLGRFGLLEFLLLAGSSLLVGLIVARITKTHWDEHEQLVVLTKLDVTGTVFLLLYLAARLLSKRMIIVLYHGTDRVLIASLIVVFGVSTGRLLGLARAVQRTYQEQSTTPAE